MNFSSLYQCNKNSMTKLMDRIRCTCQHGHFIIRLIHRLVSYPIHSCFLLFLIYLQIMDVILYFKIRSRGTVFTNATQTNDHIFGSLPVKKIMVGQMTQFLRSPLAECLEWKFHLTTYFPSISANSISFLHCSISLISMKFFASDSLSRRRIGVVLFEFRSFLDCLDGVIYRAHSRTHHYKSHYGHAGYYIDAISDILGGICLMIGCSLHFWKYRSIRQVNRMNEEETDRMIVHLEEESKVLSSSETKRCILITLGSFALRYSLSGMFWDRNVRVYEELLDTSMNKPQQSVGDDHLFLIFQLTILHSPLTILILYFWRYLSAITLQDYLLFAIFFDRTWDFIHRSNLIGWIFLLITIILTELHSNQIRSSLLFSVL